MLLQMYASPTISIALETSIRVADSLLLLLLFLSRSSKCTWLAAYQALISDTFSPRDVYWCIWEEKANWVVAWPRSQSFVKMFPLFTSLPLSISPHSLSLPLALSLFAMRGQEWSGEMRCSISVFLLACAIENTARQGPRQQIGEMQMGGEKAPRWHSGPARMWLQPPGWSQHWQSAPIDGWTKPGTGCENGWGQSGNLTQTNKMKDREELPAKAFRQYKSQSNLLTANWAQEECLHQYKWAWQQEWLSFSW